MVNINVVFNFRLKKLGDGWVGGGGVAGWVVFTEIKDRFEPIKNDIDRQSQNMLKNRFCPSN